MRHLLRLPMMRMAQRMHLPQGQNRGAQRETRQRFAQLQKMRPGAQPRVHLQHHRLAQRIDRRIGHLGKSLSEERVQWAWRTSQWRQSCIVAHRPHRILALRRHRLQDHAHVFARIAEAVLQTIEFRGRERRRRFV